MTSLVARLSDILADPLASARAAPRAIGYVGFDIPEDLLSVPGITACHLSWREGVETPRADHWLERSFAPWSRSILEDWAAGHFDFLEAVIFTRGDDSAQRLYYYVCDLQRTGQLGGPKPLIFDYSGIPNATSAERCVESLRQLAGVLGVSDDALAAGRGLANRRRRWMLDAQASRVGDGALFERIARASLFAPLEDYAQPSGGTDKGRVLLAGSPPSSDWLHRAVDDAGWAITGEAHAMSLLRLGAPIEEAGDPFEAAGRHAHSLVWGKRAFVDRATWLVAQAKATRAAAVILWLYEEEEALPWHVPAQQRALAEAGIPVCVLARRAWDGSDSSAEDARAFIEGLGA